MASKDTQHRVFRYGLVRDEHRIVSVMFVNAPEALFSVWCVFPQELSTI
jgi:hypothetical protein